LLVLAIGLAALPWPTAISAADPTANALDAYLPAEGTRAVVAVADAPRTWQALDTAGLGDAMLPAFRGTFASLEWALLATTPETGRAAKGRGAAAGDARKGAAASSPATLPSPPVVAPSGPPAESGAALLCLARVADPERLRAILPEFERALGDSLATGNVHVGRTEEAIGDVTVVMLTNGEQSAGYLLSGRLGVWASSTDAALLRATARRIARETPAAPAAKGPLAEAQAAAARLRKEGGAAPNVLVLLPAPGPESTAALGAVDWLRAILGGTASRPVVAAVSLKERAIRVEVLSGGAARGPGEAPKGGAAFPPLGDLCVAPSGALVQWGTTRLDTEAFRQALLGQVDRSLSALPPPNRAGLTPASDLQRQSLGALRGTLSDTQRWPLELGPEAWVVLNRFEFGREGELPAVDLVAAVRTRDEAATRAHLADWEARLLAAVAPAPGGSGSAQPAAKGPAPRFSERDEKLTADGQTVHLRWLEAPALPAGLRPAWALRGDLLCLALSPDSLAEALRRAAAPATQNAGETASSPARSLMERLGLPRPSAALVAWPERSAGPAAVLRGLAARASEPWMARLLGGAADRWAHAESLTVAREDDPDGVRTVARVVLSAAPVAPAVPAATAKNAGEVPTAKSPGSAKP
jgi:hypothetical protein